MLGRCGIVGLAIAAFGVPATAFEKTQHPASGKWALEREIPEDAYVLASSGAFGAYLICFEAGNVHTVTVAVGDESSVIARGSCTIFAPTKESGIVVGFAKGNRTPQEHPIALGSFRIITEETED